MLKKKNVFKILFLEKNRGNNGWTMFIPSLYVSISQVIKGVLILTIKMDGMDENFTNFITTYIFIDSTDS